MNTDLIKIIFELRYIKPVWSSSNEEKLFEMGQIAETVENLKLKKKLTETVELSFGVHFVECILVNQRWRNPSECYCQEIKLCEERFINLFKSLHWEHSEEETRNRLLDRLLGKETYILPAVILKDDVHVIEERPCVVEFQAFNDSNDEYIVKELTFLDMNKNAVYYFLFKPPFSFRKLCKKAQRSNNWLMNNYHYITWGEGFTSYKEVCGIMYYFCSKFTTFYTTGSKKRNWIKMYTTRNVYDTLIDRSFKESYEGVCVCVQNQIHSASNCALQKAYRLAAFLRQGQNCCGGGDMEKYKYESSPQTMHQYYSELRGDNI